MESFMRWIKEPSTWRGITALAGLAGVVISPEIKEEIIAGCVALYGLIQIVRRETK